MTRLALFLASFALLLAGMMVPVEAVPATGIVKSEVSMRHCPGAPLPDPGCCRLAGTNAMCQLCCPAIAPDRVAVTARSAAARVAIDGMISSAGSLHTPPLLPPPRREQRG